MPFCAPPPVRILHDLRLLVVREVVVVATSGPIQSADRALKLDVPAMAYTTLEPAPDFDHIADGHMALLEADVVYGVSGPPRLCRAPKVDAPSGRFNGCSESSPVVAGSPARRSCRPASACRNVFVHEGPVVVRRIGPALAQVVLVKPSYGRVLKQP